MFYDLGLTYLVNGGLKELLNLLALSFSTNTAPYLFLALLYIQLLLSSLYCLYALHYLLMLWWIWSQTIGKLIKTHCFKLDYFSYLQIKCLTLNLTGYDNILLSSKYVQYLPLYAIYFVFSTCRGGTLLKKQFS